MAGDSQASSHFRDEEVKVGPAAARSPSKFTGAACLVMARESYL